jgi:hypothetical protein
MRYLLLICGADEADPDPIDEPDPDAEPCWVPYVREMAARGIGLPSGGQLQPASSATTVRNRDGEVLLSDGPFAETKEQIIGFTEIECANLDEAIEAAALHPAALWGSVEVRPIRPGTAPRP